METVIRALSELGFQRTLNPYAFAGSLIITKGLLTPMQMGRERFFKDRITSVLTELFVMMVGVSENVVNVQSCQIIRPDEVLKDPRLTKIGQWWFIETFTDPVQAEAYIRYAVANHRGPLHGPAFPELPKAQ